MGSRFPIQQQRQHDDVHRALDVSLVAVQGAVDALSRVEDSSERVEMAATVHSELQTLRALVRQLDCSDLAALHDEADLPAPRRS